MQPHHTEIELQTFVLAPEEFSAEQSRLIRDHLGECALCDDLFKTYSAMYSDIEEGMKDTASEKEKEMAAQLLEKQKARRLLPISSEIIKSETALDAYYEIIEPVKRNLPTRIMYYTARHPVQSSFQTLLAAALVWFAFKFSTPGKAHDTNPVFARIQNNVLTVFNERAETLWIKSVIGSPNRKTSDDDHGDHNQRVVRLGDVDDDGVNEILLSGVNRSGRFTYDSLFCYNNDGTLRWAINIGPIISFGDPSILQHNVRMINDFIVLKKNVASAPQLFVLANEVEFSPTKLAELDPKTGREIHAYYNRGGGGTLLHKDIDYDGGEELIFVGINDGFNRAFLSALDPADIDGHAPVPPKYLPQGTPPAKEKCYMLFPLSPLGRRYSQVAYNVPSHLSQQGNKLYYHVKEFLRHFPMKDLEIQIVYSIDSLYRISSIAAGDGLIQAQEYLLKNNIIQKPLLPDFLNALKDSVLYWDGEKFVNTPTLNKLYRSAKNMP